MSDEKLYSFGELQSSGLLWLINTTVLHPRGMALALSYPEGEDQPDSWTITQTKAGEPFVFSDAEGCAQKWVAFLAKNHTPSSQAMFSDTDLETVCRFLKANQLDPQSIPLGSSLEIDTGTESLTVMSYVTNTDGGKRWNADLSVPIIEQVTVPLLVTPHEYGIEVFPWVKIT